MVDFNFECCVFNFSTNHRLLRREHFFYFVIPEPHMAERLFVIYVIDKADHICIKPL
jgi:hypothetical protein